MTIQDLTRAPQHDPLDIYRYRDGIYAVDLLITGVVHLDFFSWLAAHPTDLAGVCSGLGLAERPADVMLTLFAANGFVRAEQGVFQVTPLGLEHLVQSSPWFLGPYFASLKDRPVCADLLRVLRTGKPANWGSSKTELEWSKAMETEAFAQSFTAAMDCRGIYLGQALAARLDLRGRKRLLDIAGGSGIYACAIAAAHSHMEAVVFEKPPVDRVAQTLITQRGCAKRVRVAAGDMFRDALPSDCDVHLISNVLHDWDVPVVKSLLAKSFAALPTDGLIVLHDMHLNAEKNGPLPVAEYSVILMHSTEGRCFGVGEMEAWLHEVGFTDVTFTPTVADRSFITARKAI